MNNWMFDAINYQINLRSIANNEPRNPIEAAWETAAHHQEESPLSYLRQHLSTIKALGVNLLHIMPPFEMGVEARKGIGSPYAVKNYLAIDPEFGTLEEFKSLVHAAHRLGLRIMLGLVPNHTSRDNIWITENPEYYVKDDTGEAAFDLDWSDTAKLDYTQTGLRQAMKDVLDYWLNLLGDGEGVDGFRFDMAHFINDTSFWSETLPVLEEKYKAREPLFLAECYGRQNNLDLFKLGMHAAYDDELYKVCEYGYGRDAQGSSVLSLSAEAENNGDFKPVFEAWKKEGVSAAVQHIMDAYLSEGQATSCVLARYTDNHDEGRGVYRFGPECTRVLNEIIFLLPGGIPFLLCGQEFGAENRPSIHERFGICDKGYRLIEDAETPIPGVEIEGNVFARGPENRKAWYTFYKTLASLRTEHPALRRGTIVWGDTDHPDLLRCTIEFEGQQFLLLANLGVSACKTEVCSGKLIYGSNNADGLLPAFSTQLFAQS